MGKHLSAGAAPAGSGPGDPPIPVDPCMVEVKQKQAVNKAPKQEVIVEITPKEREKGIEPIEPKKLPQLFKPCGKLHIGEKNLEVVRNFLRSRLGRHLADSVYNYATAITAEALIEAIPEALNEKNRYGGNTWQRHFDEVKKATINGTWLD